MKRKCQCVELNYYLHHPKVLDSDFGGVRCGVCIDLIVEAKNALVTELAGACKTKELLLKGMESQAELMDGLKQRVRQLEGAKGE